MHHTTLTLTAAALAALIALPAHAANGARMLQRADANGDGVIERSEVEQARVQRFDRMDVNRDGAIDRDELAGLCRRAATPGAAQSGPGRACGARLLQRTDQDGDGRISREEAAAAPRLAGRFDEVDGNRDGFLAKEELRAAGEQRRAEMRERAEQRFKEADKNGDGQIDLAEAQAGSSK